MPVSGTACPTDLIAIARYPSSLSSICHLGSVGRDSLRKSSIGSMKAAFLLVGTQF